MMPDAITDISVAKILAAILGAFVSLRFIVGTLMQRVTAFIGGVALSYYGSTPFASWMGVAQAEGLVGFMIGTLGMAIVLKIYEAIQVTDAGRISGAFTDWLVKKWRA